MAKRYFIRERDVPTYHPANHSGTTNRRLIGPETVGAKNVEVVLGVIEKNEGAAPHAHPEMEQVCYMLEGTAVAEIDGERHDLVGRSTEAIVDLGISLVPEGRRLFPKLSVEENLLLGAFRPLARTAIAHNLDSSYETFPVLRERRRQLAGSLSGGEQQMLALARALMSAPKILLIDEPSVGLAPVLVKRTIEKIKELKERYQLTVLMAEQNFNQAVRIADRGYVIVHGKIAFEGGSADELNNNELVRKFYLGL